MSMTVPTNAVAQLPIDALAKTITYDGDLVATISVVFGGVTYTKTYTNNGTYITGISIWEAQS